MFMYHFTHFQAILLTARVLLFLQGWSVFCQFSLALGFCSCEEKGNASYV